RIRSRKRAGREKEDRRRRRAPPGRRHARTRDPQRSHRSVIFQAEVPLQKSPSMTTLAVEWPRVVEKVFRFFFKYPLLMFQQGDFSWGLSRSVLMVVAVVTALAVLALLTYRGVPAAERRRDRIVLIGLRLAALAVLLFCLFRPTLILKAAVPQQNFLGVLVDDSRSMSIADRDGQTRSAFVQQELGGPKARLLQALSQRFVVRFFHFSPSA